MLLFVNNHSPRTWVAICYGNVKITTLTDTGLAKLSEQLADVPVVMSAGAYRLYDVDEITIVHCRTHSISRGKCSLRVAYGRCRADADHAARLVAAK